MAKKYHRDTWVGLVLLCFCAFFLFNAMQIPGEAAYLPKVGRRTRPGTTEGSTAAS